MVYDPKLAERIRRLVISRDSVTEKEMFGGLAFLKDGRMFCCILGRELLARVGPAGEDAAKSRPHARSLNLIGYEMSGCVLVQPGGLATDPALGAWLDECEAHAVLLIDRPRRMPRRSARHARQTGGGPNLARTRRA